MYDEILYNLKNSFDKYGIIICFTGPFSQGIIEEIGDALKAYLKRQENVKSKLYKVFSVFIEQTQNVKNYAFSMDDEKEQEEILASGFLAISKCEGDYLISSGNLIKGKDIEGLSGKIDAIKSLEKKELDKLYRQKLREKTSFKGSGAGLGIIEMGRKSKDIEYKFTKKEDGKTFFLLKVLV